MTTLNPVLEERIIADLPVRIQAIENVLSSSDPSSKRRLVDDLGGLMAEWGILEPDRASSMNSLVLAIYRNPELDSYMQQYLAPILRDQHAIEILQQWADDTAQPVAQEDFEYIFNKIIVNGDLTLEPMRVLLSSDEVRAAIGLADQEAADQYLALRQQAMASASTWDEWVAKAKELDYYGPTLCSAGIVCVSVVAIVFAVVDQVAGAQAYVAAYAVAIAAVVTVTCASGQVPSFGDGASLVPLQAGPVKSVVRNETSFTLWAAVPSATGLTRVPVESGTDTTITGLVDLHAVLIGGQGNPLISLRLDTGVRVTRGAYVLANDAGSPGIITFVENGGEVEVQCNSSQALAEEGGWAGYSDLEGSGSAGQHYDQRWRVEEVAAAFPSHFPLALQGAYTREVGYVDRVVRYGRAYLPHLEKVARSNKGQQ